MYTQISDQAELGSPVLRNKGPVFLGALAVFGFVATLIGSLECEIHCDDKATYALVASSVVLFFAACCFCGRKVSVPLSSLLGEDGSAVNLGHVFSN